MKHTKTATLKKTRDFQLVYKKGKSASSKYMVIILLKNHAGTNRLGVSVSKKMGHAVIRNRIRRRLKEAFRLLDVRLNRGYDLIILPRQPICDATFAEIETQMRYCLRKHGILSKSQKGEA